MIAIGGDKGLTLWVGDDSFVEPLGDEGIDGDVIIGPRVKGRKEAIRGGNKWITKSHLQLLTWSRNFLSKKRKESSWNWTCLLVKILLDDNSKHN